MRRCQDEVLVLGAGLAGLSAGHALARAGVAVRVVEKAASVGGLARTVAHGAFRFDLGGHRFFSGDPALSALVGDLLGGDALTVHRRSQILLRGRYIDYPLSPLNAMAGLGAGTACRIALDHAAGKLRRLVRRREPVSLEDWVVDHFGRTLFQLYFEAYSEKVWGVPCQRISRDWVAQRIQGLSLGAAVWHAFTRRGGAERRTLLDRFVYPAHGIGTLSDRLRDEIAREHEVRCGVEVRRLHHRDGLVRAALLHEGGRTSLAEAGGFVSTVPLPELVRMLDPPPPPEVLRAAAGLRFRDLVVVAVMLDRERATDQSWVYFPERRVRFGRIHEPTNWSAAMAPPGRTLLVAEQFCFRGDETWTSSDGALADQTVADLARLGIVARREVLDAVVLRVPQAYPLFEVGYERHRATVDAWLRGLRNLFPAGRGGTFSYHNMDHAMASGLEAAEGVLGALAAHERRAAGPLAARRIA